METVQREWGHYETHLRTLHCVMKTLTVLPGHAISYQFHNCRSEFWVIERGAGEIWLNDQKAKVSAGYSVKIPTEQKHRIINTGDTDLVIREIQFGENCNENDIVRLDYVI